MIKQFCFVGDADYLNKYLLNTLNSVEVNNPDSFYHIITNSIGLDLNFFSKITTNIKTYIRSNLTENLIKILDILII